ncbi:MAG: hypothetical protein AAB225_13155 [Acidobacteriota bacterium]
MRLLVLLLCVLPATAADLAQVQSVYLLPMGNGLDQFLASRLTSLGLFQVVTDPKKADALFTDRLGETLEAKLNELYPPPAPPKPEKKAEEAKEEAKPKEEATPRSPSWGSGKGNVFIVSARTRAVLWSAYERPRDSSPDEMNRTAERIVKRLQREIKGK